MKQSEMLGLSLVIMGIITFGIGAVWVGLVGILVGLCVFTFG